MDNVLKSTHQAALTLKLLKKLDIRPQPMFRPQGLPIEPITLFQKMGVGQLDLYILNPCKNSQEYQALMENWPDALSSASKSQTLPLTALASVCALLVWHPACPQEKLVRVLFPGVTPQTKLLHGLEKLKGLAFLEKPIVTTGDLERLGVDKRTIRTESQESGRSQGKETLKHGKERGLREEGKDALMKEKVKALNGAGGKNTEKNKNKEVRAKQKAAASEKNITKKGGGKNGKRDEKTGDKEENGTMKNEQVKQDGLSTKPKNDNKSKFKKEAKNDSKPGVTRTKKSLETEKGKKKHVNTEMPNNNKAASGAGLEIPKSPCPVTEQHNQSLEKEPEQDPCGSKMSTPEDMTADFLRLREETEQEEAHVRRADKQMQRSSESGNEKSLKGWSKGTNNEAADTLGAEAAGGPGIMKGESGEVQHKAGTGGGEPPGSLTKPAKVAGFPCPLNKAPKTERTVQMDLTPTEYTLLDGALRYSPSSRSPPENQAPASPDEGTVELASPDSRPNSAGHTPYCLSPDDVWGNRATLSRLQAQMSNVEHSDVRESNGSAKQSERQPFQAGHIPPREKHLTFLSLGTFKDGSSDPSPSLATTTTTHSMPAEVSSPQSTEVDESLSMSFEQGPANVSQREGDDAIPQSHSNGGHYVGMSLPTKKPPRSLGHGSDMGRCPAPNTLHLEASPHDVDLCLVSPCEFKHFKPPDPSSGAFAAHHHGNNNNNPKDLSLSESNAPVCTEDCPSTTADGALDSDDDESCSEPTNSPCDLHPGQTLPPDPLPLPLRDSPPLPPHPDASMPVPQSDSDTRGKKAKANSTKLKKPPGVSESTSRFIYPFIYTGLHIQTLQAMLFCFTYFFLM